MAEITLEQVSKVYPGGTTAVDRVDLEIPDGSLTVLVGPSGCGKTTLLRMIAGLEDITGGTVQIGDRVVNQIAPKDRDVAMVFQNYALYPHMSVYENVAFGLRERKVRKREVDERVRKVAKVLDLDKLLERKPGQLSGGQQQRVAMGRAIVREPRAFLMDEPLSNLDAKLRVQMRTEISRLQRDLGSTMVYVTHDQVEAMTMGDQVAVLRNGRLQQLDTPKTLYENPVNLFVAGFIGSPAMNLIQATIVDRDGSLWAEFGGHGVCVDDRLASAPALRGHVGRTVALGIRPETLEDARLAADAPDNRCIVVEVDLCEALGPEVLVHFELDAAPVVTEHTRELAEDAGEEQVRELEEQADATKSRIVAAIDARTKAQEGESMKLVVDVDRLHFFDLETGHAIREDAR
jgi:multiple sugar transport system ATP-binding protein